MKKGGPKRGVQNQVLGVLAKSRIYMDFYRAKSGVLT